MDLERCDVELEEVELEPVLFEVTPVLSGLDIGDVTGKP